MGKADPALEYSHTARTFSDIHGTLKGILSSQRDDEGDEGTGPGSGSDVDSDEALCEESEFSSGAADSDREEGEEEGDGGESVDEDDHRDSESDGDEHVFRSRRHSRRAAARISSQQRLDLCIPASDAAHEDFIYRRPPRHTQQPPKKLQVRRSSRRRSRGGPECMTVARGNQVLLSPAYRLRNRDKHQLPAKSGLGLVSWNSLDVPSEEPRPATGPSRRRDGGRAASSGSPSSSTSSTSSTPVKKRRGTPVEATVVRGDLRFDQIAGVDTFLVQLQEMIVLPLVFPDLFSRLGLVPPKGVLFHGPPGTGKTLLARILASASSRMAGRPVTFFHRNGAECLSKWIGEAEQNLVKLFHQAREQAPSIIFFDEIDGMAPDRSGNGRPPDQSHISLVSTLLSLMDGLEDRGAVVVIGATNRVDAVDPALRRPGRFDKEFGFSLPDQRARRAILGLSAPPGASIAPWLLDRLARETDGLSGADLKGLCTEAALLALRRACPSLYRTEDAEELQPGTGPDLMTLDLSITEDDFKAAMPARRTNTSRESEALPRPLQRLLEPCLGQLVRDLERLAWRPLEGSWRAAAQQIRLPLATLAFGSDPEGLNSLSTLDLLRMKRRFLFSLASRVGSGANVVLLDPAVLVMGQQQSADAVLLSRYRASQHSGHVLVVPDLDRLFAFVSDDVFALWLQEWSMTETARLLTIEPRSELLSGIVRQRLQVTFSIVGTAERQAFIDYCLGRQDPHDLAAIMGVVDSQLPAAGDVDTGMLSGHEEGDEAEEPSASAVEDEVTPLWLNTFARASILYHRHIDSQLGW